MDTELRELRENILKLSKDTYDEYQEHIGESVKPLVEELPFMRDISNKISILHALSEAYQALNRS